MSTADSRPTLLSVVERHGRWISATLRTRFPHEAQDLEQEVMLRLGRNLPHLDRTSDASIRAFVSRVLRSVMVDEIRRRRLQRPASAEVADIPDPRAQARDPELHEEARRAEGAFAFLSPEQRRVLRLHFNDGFSLRQIAELVGVPHGTVAAWYSRALRLLRENLS